jgi:hypothetical protein
MTEAKPLIEHIVVEQLADGAIRAVSPTTGIGFIAHVRAGANDRDRVRCRAPQETTTTFLINGDGAI